MERKVNVIEDLDGKKTVFIHDILFKGRRSVNWDEVEQYLRQYIGDFYQIEDCNKIVYIGTDLPDEYTHLILDLHFQYSEIMEKLNDIMSLM